MQMGHDIPHIAVASRAREGLVQALRGEGFDEGDEGRELGVVSLQDSRVSERHRPTVPRTPRRLRAQRARPVHSRRRSNGHVVTMRSAGTPALSARSAP